ncbi:hypothetical protein BDZ97DRAFT_1907336 [Flammula alnicola]|nr:hypothetical protein BDZ97DRAFT_1907336 [Flammula alnicola]
MSFETLPTELYDSIFGHIPSLELQQTVLAVTRAIPLSAVALYNLFQSIRLTRPEQAILLYRRLRLRNTSDASTNASNSLPDHEQIASWVKEFSVEAWSVDAEIVINLVHLLPNLQSFNLWVGPNSFTPEHLEELFSKPLMGLRYLALRFRPHVWPLNDFSSHSWKLICIKGAYFDSTLVALSRWPSSSLPTLSIIQDPLNQEKAQKQGFAQPIVFFRLDLALLLHSPALSPSLKSLRLRIPLRPVARALCSTAASSSPHDSMVLPNLEFLDLSTCGVLDGEVDTILARFMSLKHIVLDGCSILRGELHEGEGNSLGKRAKEREKALKAWVESRSVCDAIGYDPNNDRRARRGRKGLATATISLRDTKPIATTSSSRTVLKDQPAQSSKKGLQKIRILPSLPNLLSLSITLSPLIKPEKYPVIRAEFDEGWAEGIAQLAVTRARLRTSAGNGVRVMRVSSTHVETEGDSLEDGLYGLENVDQHDPDAFGMSDKDDGFASLAAPILCFAGPGRGGAHEKNCGHSVGWEVMKDEM